ncbi:sorbitol dehydrogenase [Chimaeribacter coloradensis]|uniref:Sorbitol dehydrogenase n=1 Tax=Chimaeribacter coloradensis TaxID=2060068 RepID=A0A2N5DV01_9GAMM|nr:sugar dehydrogenase complex small subunit [Chimaeribacter coloradensis]PLR30757.1 sorbitol dehydrogenase [Chimaeribacter coloradensis]
MKDVVPTRQVSRRMFIGGALAALSVPLVSSLLTGNALAVPSPALMQAKADFIRLSQLLTGHPTLDADMAERLYQHMLTLYPDFTRQVQALAQFVEAERLSAENLHAAITRQQPALAALPAAILTAWYLGVVGTGKQAVCLAYENALMNQAVRDHLTPPSYAYGAYGTWATKPQ